MRRLPAEAAVLPLGSLSTRGAELVFCPPHISIFCAHSNFPFNGNGRKSKESGWWTDATRDHTHKSKRFFSFRGGTIGSPSFFSACTPKSLSLPLGLGRAPRGSERKFKRLRAQGDLEIPREREREVA